MDDLLKKLEAEKKEIEAELRVLEEQSNNKHEEFRYMCQIDREIEIYISKFMDLKSNIKNNLEINSDEEIQLIYCEFINDIEELRKKKELDSQKLIQYKEDPKYINFCLKAEELVQSKQEIQTELEEYDEKSNYSIQSQKQTNLTIRDRIVKFFNKIISPNNNKHKEKLKKNLEQIDKQMDELSVSDEAFIYNVALDLYDTVQKEEAVLELYRQNDEQKEVQKLVELIKSKEKLKKEYVYDLETHYSINENIKELEKEWRYKKDEIRILKQTKSKEENTYSL